MTVRQYVEPPAPARLRFWCWTLVIVPLVIIFGAEAASQMWGAGASAAGSFTPTPETMLASVLGAGLYAAVFTVLLYRLRGYRTEGFLPRYRGNSFWRDSPWWTGVTLFALLAGLVPLMLCGAINREIGQVTRESWNVQDKEHNQTSRGCEFRLTVASSTTDDSTRVCVPRERWQRLRVGDALAIVATFSGLGSEIGAAPEPNRLGHAR